jgi:hypothetical protein
MACLLSGLLIGLSLVVLCDNRPYADFRSEKITVHIVGAVEEAHLQVNDGATLEDLFLLVKLHSDADISELDGVRRLTNGEVIVIPGKGQTTVYVTGAVEEAKVVIVPQDGGPNSVLQSVKVRNNADTRSFLRRKRVKNGEVIEIKAKKQAKSDDRPIKN